MDRGCSVTVWAHAGFAVLGTDDDGESIQETYSSEPINLSCDDVTLTDDELTVIFDQVLEDCTSLSIPLIDEQTQAEQCALGVWLAVDYLEQFAATIESEILYSMNVDVTRDFWFHGESEVDYQFLTSRTEQRHPLIINGGKFYSGFTGEAQTPNVFPSFCPAQRIGKIDVNLDRHYTFGGGARAYTTYNFGDAVVCPLYDIVNNQALVAAYGFTAKITQSGDRR